MRQANSNVIVRTAIYLPYTKEIFLSVSRKPTPSPFALALGERLRVLRERRHTSPEDLAIKCGMTGSYIRRVEKGIHSPTVEVLADILNALGSNLGVFFEYMLEGQDVEAQDRRLHHIVQRALTYHRAETVTIIRLLERQNATD